MKFHPLAAILPILLVAFEAQVRASSMVEGQSAPGEPALSLVSEGTPNAEIVIAAENRPRMVTLAALELRKFLEEITGARLPIVTTKSPDVPVQVCVGRSPETDKLGISAEGLEAAAYRIVSGPNWLILIGDDFDYDPGAMPLASRVGDPKAIAQWEEDTKGKTDTAWGFPFSFNLAFRRFWNPSDFNQQLSSRYGEDVPQLWGSKTGFWDRDEGGTLNAVTAFLRSLGVRWYMAGALGQVLPEKTANLSVGPFNETVTPDFAVRDWMWYNYASFGFDDVLWAKQLGMSSGEREIGLLKGPHGLVSVHSSPAMRETHPDYYALVGGKRDTGHRDRGTPCFTSEGLIKETVNYIRFMYDTYDVPSVDIWSVDGLKLCQCEGCKGKSASELVWGFADKVAREVYKTHPDKLITAGAYTSYIDPPDSIDKFSPNLAVWIANSGRPRMTEEEHWNEYHARVKKWQSKMVPGNILRLENNRFHIWGMGEGEDGKQVRGAPLAYPVIHPRAVARDLKALKGISRGDTGEQSQFQGKWKVPGLEHITLYVQSRFLWNADLDVDDVLNDYCKDFYGPAAKEMKNFIDFAEANMALKDESRGRGRGDFRNVSLNTALKLRDLLDKAKVAAGESIYGQRVQAVINDLQTREDLIADHQKRDADLAEARAKSPVARGVAGNDLSKAPTHKLGGFHSSKPPSVDTSFQIGWENNALLLDILCNELILANAVSSRLTLANHLGFAKAYAEDPTDPKGRSYTLRGRKVSIQEMLNAGPWDFVTIQQRSTQSHRIDSYRPHAAELVEIIRKLAQDAEVVIHQTLV